MFGCRPKNLLNWVSQTIYFKEVYLKTDMIGAIKVEKVAKTKFRKRDENDDYNTGSNKKKKHHDKSFYRLAREEDDYEFNGYDKKTNSRY